MCRIGQNERCCKTGCEFSKAFGVNCHGLKSLQDSPEYVEAVEKRYGEIKITGYTSDSVFNGIPIKTGALKKSKAPKTKKNTTLAKSSKERNLARRKVIWNRSSSICYLCGEYVSFDEFTIEHLKPKSRGGTNDLSNLRASHFHCNQKKGSKLLSPEVINKLNNRLFP